MTTSFTLFYIAIFSYVVVPVAKIPQSFMETLKYYWTNGRDFPEDLQNLGDTPIEFDYPSMNGWTFRVTWQGRLIGEHTYVIWLNNVLVQDYPRREIVKKDTGVQKSTHQVFDEPAFL